MSGFFFFFFFSSRRRHTRFDCDWSSDVCSSDLTWTRLPADFVGCWRGTIQGEDFKPAIPGNTMSQDPATYELCYGPVPQGTYRLNLMKLVIGMAVVRPDRFESQVLSADDQAGTAKIRNHLILTQT